MMLNLCKTREMLINDCIDKIIECAYIDEGKLIYDLPDKEFLLLEAKLTGLNDHNFRQIDEKHFIIFDTNIVTIDGYWKPITEKLWFEYMCINKLAVGLKNRDNVDATLEEDCDKYYNLIREAYEEILDVEKHIKIVRKV